MITFAMDCGLYKVTASNLTGAASCQATLLVKPIKYERKLSLDENADLVAQAKRTKLARSVLADSPTSPIGFNERAQLALENAERKINAALRLITV